MASVVRTIARRAVAATVSGSPSLATCQASGASDTAKMATTLLSGAETAKRRELNIAVMTPVAVQPTGLAAEPDGISRR